MYAVLEEGKKRKIQIYVNYLELPRDGCRPRKGHRTSVLSRDPVKPAPAPAAAAQRTHDEGGGRLASGIGGGSPEVVVPQVGERHAARRHRVLRRVDLHLDLGGDRRLGGQLLPVNVERVPDEIQLLR